MKVTALVPAYNEEKNIAHLLDFLKTAAVLDEIICINDGSSDSTLRKIKAIMPSIPHLKLVNFPKNHGKAYAISEGVKKAQGEIVVFIDADVIHFNTKALSSLVVPLLKRKYDAVIGYSIHNILDPFFKPITGQRAYFRKELLPHVKEFQNKGYGLELYLNFLYKDKKVKVVQLKGVGNIFKYDKQTAEDATKMQITEWKDILTEIFKQDNPLYYFIQSYLHPYYFRKPENISAKITKLGTYIKNNVKNIAEENERTA
jgi:polyisoprenyl-phosphate glycosyltransferase